MVTAPGGPGAGSTGDVAARLESVRARIVSAASDAGRDPDTVTLIAVSKTVDVTRMRAAYDAGQRDFGENRAQELIDKAPQMPADCRWHMIGAVQTNKVRLLARRVPVTRWHTVDRAALVDELATRVRGASVLLEVNVGDEASKAGCRRDDVDELAGLGRGAGLDVRGLMGVPPAAGDPRPHFRWLRDTAQRLGLPEISMGMSGDFEVAISEGATFVRVGTAIFGSRPRAT